MALTEAAQDSTFIATRSFRKSMRSLFHSLFLGFAILGIGLTRLIMTWFDDRPTSAATLWIAIGFCGVGILTAVMAYVRKWRELRKLEEEECCLRLGLPPNKYFSEKVLRALVQAGWSPRRDAVELERACAEDLGTRWVPAAGPFIRSFGNLSIGHTLWVGPIRLCDVPDVVERVAGIVGAKACPVAVSGYMGDSCMLWVDGNHRYYAVDKEGLVFLGEDMVTTLEVLLGSAQRPAPPPELAEALAKAFRWDDDSVVQGGS
jgi:hypothetical protein